MTPEQFNALVRMIDPPPSWSRGEAIADARKLLVEEPAKEICNHDFVREIGVDFEICNLCGLEQVIKR